MISAAQLEQLGEACRGLLTEAPTPARIAQSYLHLRNAHPTSLTAYESLFSPTVRDYAHARGFAKSVALKIKAVARRENFYFGDALPGRAEILFISHFTDREQASSGRDNYFGNLPTQLANSRNGVVVAHINHTWLRWQDIRDTWRSQNPQRIVLSRTLGFGHELQLAQKANEESPRLRATKGRPDFSQAVAEQAAKHTLDGPTLTALRAAIQIGDLVEKLRPKYLVSTFEGHAWERLAFHAARQRQPTIKCIGYHHTVLFPHTFALGLALGHGFDPDAILTTGGITKDWFDQQQAWADLPVNVLGSVRAPDMSLVENTETRETCLVVPEGIVDESIVLFDLAVAAAKIMPEQKFILRLHPILSKSEIEKSAPRLRELPSNVRWSTQKLEQDIGDSNFVLYRGSTVVLTAVLNGSFPVYVRSGGEKMSIDPLEALTDWGGQVSSPVELKSVMEDVWSLSAKQRQAGATKGRDYCARYFQPLSAAALLQTMRELESS